MTLEQFNRLPPAQARQALARCCVSRRWIAQLCAERPFASSDDLYEAAGRIWTGLEKADYLEAFEGHPKIGDPGSLRARYAATKLLAAGEQAGALAADEAELAALAAGNRAYEARFGFIFIVCASGKSAAEMLALLECRLTNAPAKELAIAAAEQAKITRLRLEKLLTGNKEHA